MYTILHDDYCEIRVICSSYDTCVYILQSVLWIRERYPSIGIDRHWMTSTDTQRNIPSYANNLKLLVDESSSRFFPDNLCRYFHIKCCDPGCWYTSEMSHVGLNELVGRSLAGGQQFSVQVHIYMSHLFHVCALDTWPTARKPSIGVTSITLAQVIPRTTT